MKLGLSYNVFDGEELLEGSIKQIRGEVDYISVVYQTVSNFGHSCDENLILLLEDLKSSGLIDETYKYTPTDIVGSTNELKKRNIGLELSIKNGCTHHMSIDTDEYYNIDEFRNMKKIVTDGDYDSSVCQMITYYNKPIYRIEPKETYYVPLIYKIRKNVLFGKNKFPVIVDPTRKMEPGNCKIFTREEIEMHHLSYVRNNIFKKLNNSSAKKNFESEISFLVDYFNSWEYGKKALMPGRPCKYYDVVEVENKFNIKLKNG